MKQNLMTSALCGFGGAVLALAFVQTTDSKEAAPRAEQLVLRGAGESRVVVGFMDEAGVDPGIWIYDEAGTLRAELFYARGDEDDEHERGALQLFGEEALPVVSLSTSLFSHHGRTSSLTIQRDGESENIIDLGASHWGPHLELGSKDHTDRILMYTGQKAGHENEATLRLKSKETSFAVSLDEFGAYVNAWSAGGNAVHAGVTSEENPNLKWHRDGETRVQLQFDD